MPRFDPDSPHQSPRPPRPRRPRSAAHRPRPPAGLPARYRKLYLEYDPENPSEFVVRMLNMLAADLFE